MDSVKPTHAGAFAELGPPRGRVVTRLVLTPGGYMGVAEDGEPFGEKMKRLTATLDAEFAESARLQQAIRESIRRLNYE